jgi:APA family basic amino acid/polyamine antiporter
LQPEGLKRELGVFDVALNVVNITLASGIFLLPALVAVVLGNDSIVAYFVCGGMFLLVALCYAEVGSRVTESGGAYIYLEKAFGPYIGFLANTSFWFAYGSLVTAALANGVADLLSVPFPFFNEFLYRTLLFLVLFGGFAYINVRGIKQGMLTVKIFTVIKLLPLIAIVALGMFAVRKENLSWPALPALSKLGEASLILFFTFIGGETALNISDEMKNPGRTAPLGLMTGVTALIIFYCLIHVIAQGVLGDDLVKNTKAPLAAVANVLMGAWGSALVVSCAIISITGSLNSLVMVFPRVMYAGAKEKLLPGFLSKVHTRYGTPHWAIICFCIVSFIMAVSGGFRQLVILATITVLLMFLGVALAAIKFRLKPSPEFKSSFLIPGGLTVPVLTIFMVIWFLFQSKLNEITGMTIFILAVTIIYFIKKLNLFRK